LLRNQSSALVCKLPIHYCALGDNKCPQNLVSATETVQNYNGKAGANTNGVETTIEISIMLTVERQIGIVHRPKLVAFRGTTIGMTTNKTEAQQTTCPTTSRIAMA